MGLTLAAQGEGLPYCGLLALDVIISYLGTRRTNRL